MSDDIEDIIDDFDTDYTVSRRGQGIFVNGRFTLADASTFASSGAVMPASSRDLLRLPEARRVEETIRIITKVELIMLPQADVVTYAGNDWEVQSARGWDVQGFFDCLATKVRQA